MFRFSNSSKLLPRFSNSSKLLPFHLKYLNSLMFSFNTLLCEHFYKTTWICFKCKKPGRIEILGISLKCCYEVMFFVVNDGQVVSCLMVSSVSLLCAIKKTKIMNSPLFSLKQASFQYLPGCLFTPCTLLHLLGYFCCKKVKKVFNFSLPALYSWNHWHLNISGFPNLYLLPEF